MVRYFSILYFFRPNEYFVSYCIEVCEYHRFVELMEFGTKPRDCSPIPLPPVTQQTGMHL